MLAFTKQAEGLSRFQQLYLRIGPVLGGCLVAVLWGLRLVGLACLEAWAVAVVVWIWARSQEEPP